MSLINWRIITYLPSGGPFVRLDSHIYPDYVVPPSYDSILGKLIVWAPTREKAIKRMKITLDDTVITAQHWSVQLGLSVYGTYSFPEAVLEKTLSKFYACETKAGLLIAKPPNFQKKELEAIMMEMNIGDVASGNGAGSSAGKLENLASSDNEDDEDVYLSSY